MKIKFKKPLDELDHFEYTHSEDGEFKVWRILGGFIWQVWAYDPAANDWFAQSSFFVSRENIYHDREALGAKEC